MINGKKRSLIYAGVLLAVVLGVSQALFLTALATHDFPWRLTSICFVALTTCACHYWLIKTITDKPDAFNRVFLLQTVGKLLLYISFFVCFLIFFKEHKFFFTIHFFVVYIIFAIFDVSLILKFVKKK